MNRLLLSTAIHLYAASATVYCFYLLRQVNWLPRLGSAFALVGLGFQGVSLALALKQQEGVPVGIGQGASLLTLALVTIFLFLDFRYRASITGVFLMPLATTVGVFSRVLLEEGDRLGETVRQPLLPLHVTVAALSLAAFAVAAAVALMYLVMERQLKGKRFGVFFMRVPSLQFLDELNRKLVAWGFIALSITLVTGAFFVRVGEGMVWSWQPKDVFTLVAWLTFAALLQARFFSGWQGRRAAFVTMAGFALLLVSFVTSYNLNRGMVH